MSIVGFVVAQALLQQSTSSRVVKKGNNQSTRYFERGFTLFDLSASSARYRVEHLIHLHLELALLSASDDLAQKVAAQG
jgi:hypothetical protein